MSNVIGVYSRRARGFAVPVELLRVVCRVKNRCAVRGRVASAFSGYLVTEPEALPMWRIDGRIVLIVATQERRQWLREGFDCSPWREASMDAPIMLPAGSTERRGQCGEVVAVASTLMRDGWYK